MVHIRQDMTGIFCMYDKNLYAEKVSNRFIDKFFLAIFPWPKTCSVHCGGPSTANIVCNQGLINRPGVAGAVLQIPLSLINSVSESVFLFLQIFKTSLLPNR